jgi:hypothetical protein
MGIRQPSVHYQWSAQLTVLDVRRSTCGYCVCMRRHHNRPIQTSWFICHVIASFHLNRSRDLERRTYAAASVARPTSRLHAARPESDATAASSTAAAAAAAQRRRLSTSCRQLLRTSFRTTSRRARVGQRDTGPAATCVIRCRMQNIVRRRVKIPGRDIEFGRVTSPHRDRCEPDSPTVLATYCSLHFKKVRSEADAGSRCVE